MICAEEGAGDEKKTLDRLRRKNYTIELSKLSDVLFDVAKQDKINLKRPQ